MAIFLLEIPGALSSTEFDAAETILAETKLATAPSGLGEAAKLEATVVTAVDSRIDAVSERAMADTLFAAEELAVVEKIAAAGFVTEVGISAKAIPVAVRAVSSVVEQVIEGADWTFVGESGKGSERKGVGVGVVGAVNVGRVHRCGLVEVGVGVVALVYGGGGWTRRRNVQRGRTTFSSLGVTKESMFLKNILEGEVWMWRLD